jgi:hypothetical protein
MRTLSFATLMLASSLPALSQETRADRAAYMEWRKCVLASAYIFAVSTSETADIIAQGAFGECANEERLFRSKVPSDIIDDVSSQVRRHLTEETVAYILRARQMKSVRPTQ